MQRFFDALTRKTLIGFPYKLNFILLMLLFCSISSLQAQDDSTYWHYTEPVRVDTFSNSLTTLESQFTGNRWIFSFGETVLVAFREWHSGVWIARSIDSGTSYNEYISVPIDYYNGNWNYTQDIYGFCAPTSREIHFTSAHYYIHSMDGGATWSVPYDITELSYFFSTLACRSAVAVGATQEGLVYLVGQRGMLKSFDHGLSFGEVDTTVGGIGKDVICAAETVIVVYWDTTPDTHACFKYSIDRGESWIGGRLNLPAIPRMLLNDAHFGNDFSLAGNIHRCCIVWGTQLAEDNPLVACAPDSVRHVIVFISTIAGDQSWLPVSDVECLVDQNEVFSGMVAQENSGDFVSIFIFDGAITTRMVKAYIMHISQNDAQILYPSIVMEDRIIDTFQYNASLANIMGDTFFYGFTGASTLEWQQHKLYVQKLWLSTSLNCTPIPDHKMLLMMNDNSELYDILGRSWSRFIDNLQITRESEILSTSLLPRGIYILYLPSKDQSYKLLNIGAMK